MNGAVFVDRAVQRSRFTCRQRRQRSIPNIWESVTGSIRYPRSRRRWFCKSEATKRYKKELGGESETELDHPRHPVGEALFLHRSQDQFLVAQYLVQRILIFLDGGLIVEDRLLVFEDRLLVLQNTFLVAQDALLVLHYFVVGHNGSPG
jgi:hypothetical protein